MPPNLHLHPAELRAVAGAVEELLPALRVPGLDPADRAALARRPGGAALLAEHDRITAALARTAGALRELVDGLGAVAGATVSVERGAVAAFGAVQRSDGHP